MGLEPITVTLSSFEKLEVLRIELKTREEELQGVERDLKTALRSIATQRFLKSVAPYYNDQGLPKEAASAPDLERKRQALYQVIQAIRSAMGKLESVAMSPGAAKPRSDGRRNRFE